MAGTKAVQQLAKPKKMKHEKLDMRAFKQRGPLEMKTEYSGTVRHGLDEEYSQSLQNLEYDKNLNSLVLIGSQVEKIVPHSIMKTVSSMFWNRLSSVRPVHAAPSIEAHELKSDNPTPDQPARTSSTTMTNGRTSQATLETKESTEKIPKESKGSAEKMRPKESVEKVPRRPSGKRTPKYYNLADLQRQMKAKK